MIVFAISTIAAAFALAASQILQIARGRLALASPLTTFFDMFTGCANWLLVQISPPKMFLICSFG
jgi:hypothetical protein